MVHSSPPISFAKFSHRGIVARRESHVLTCFLVGQNITGLDDIMIVVDTSRGSGRCMSDLS